MFKTKRMIALLIMGAMGIAFTGNPASAVGYVTISDIQEDAKDGWHESFYYKGEEIRVDLDYIEIPDVDKVPAVRVKWAEGLAPIYAPANAEIHEALPGGFSYSVTSELDAIFSHSSKSAGIDRYIEDNAQAENSPLTATEALEFAKEQCKPYVESMGHFELQLSFMDAWSRLYEAIEFTSSGTIMDYDKPLAKMGTYQIILNQIFFGIPYTEKRINFESVITAEGKVQDGPMGNISMTIGSKDDYTLLFAPAQSDCILTNDLPLASLSETKRKIQTLIETGYIRDIYHLRLVYQRLYDPADLGNTWILFPVWELDGEVMRNPNAATPVYSSGEMAKLRKVGGVFLHINAQTGEHYDRTDKSPDRGHAEFITWDEVK